MVALLNVVDLAGSERRAIHENAPDEKDQLQVTSRQSKVVRKSKVLDLAGESN